MSRAPLLALLFTCAVGTTPGAAWAPLELADEGQRGAAAAQALILPRSAVTAAVRRAAVADPDLDGEVTSIESARYYEMRFRLLDENRDGWIDGPEFVSAVAARSLYAVDDLARPRPLAFESVDVDGNGKLTPEEFLRADLLRRSAVAAGGREGRRQRIFGSTDRDRDGLLSQQEFLDAGRQHFLASDADGDGKVSIWEFYGGTRL